MAGWTNPLELLHEELRQRRDEGCVIPEDLEKAINTLSRETDQWNSDAVSPLYDAIMALNDDQKLSDREPNDLECIKALRPDGPRNLHWSPTQEEALDKFHGAWTGRAVGCALGKPIEGVGFGVYNGAFTGRKDIKRLLHRQNEWPLNDYISGKGAEEESLELWCPASQREHIAYMEPDDDIHYSLVGLGVIETFGPNFTWNSVAQYWSEHLPYSAICTAETQGILNYWNKTNRLTWDTVATAEYTRRYRNPYREWIGAQIRADGFAWCAAGNPELAAEFAWRDAHWTHERNGIYGEMFFAAMQAAAFVEGDWKKLVSIGLSEIPKECRLALAIQELLEWIDQYDNWEILMERVEDTYKGMSPVHTINNALVCIVGMAYSNLEPHSALCTTVAAGLDTDCNGATVGNIAGAVHGRASFNSPLVAQLNDTIKPSMIGFETVTMRTLAERTYQQWSRVKEWYSKGRSSMETTHATRKEWV
ncbi:MAG: ADP-ribosylglycohydrolase family protein [Fibrobacterales bacterium]